MARKKQTTIPEIKFHREAKLLKIIDGDTLDVEIDLGWSIKIKERIRLEGVDTPEINKRKENKYGKLVKAHVESLLPPQAALILTSVAYERTGRIRGKYGRTLATVYHPETSLCLNYYLQKKKLAWETDEKGKIKGERDLSLLTGFKKLQS